MIRLSRYALMLAVAVLTAGAWPGECWAQAKVPRVGMLISSEANDLEPAFKTAKRNGAGALILSFSPWFWVHKARIAELALRAKLPTISEYYQFVEDGGLLSYGSFLPDTWVRAAYYRLLKGAKVADLPVEQVSTFKLMVNLKTAKALGITIPQSILLRADKVIR